MALLNFWSIRYQKTIEVTFNETEELEILLEEVNEYIYKINM